MIEMKRKIGVSTPPEIRKVEDVLKVMREAEKQGLDFIEFNCTDVPPMNPKLLSPKEKEMLRENAESLGLGIAIHGSNDINLISLNPALREFAVSYIEESLKFTRYLNAELLNTHPGTILQYYSRNRFLYFDELFDYSGIFQESLKKLAILGEEYGVLICIENTSRRTNKLLVEGMQAEQSNFIALTYDVGHAYIAGDLLELKNKMKDRIKNVHIHDNDGKIDVHRGIGKGTIDWHRVFPLNSKRYTLEIRPLSEAFESKKILEALLKAEKKEI